jgi:hypothetical protein
MALVCPRHHTAVHAGIYRMQMREGLPWVQVPEWQHPDRPWLRNHTPHHDHRLADSIAATLLGGAERSP